MATLSAPDTAFSAELDFLLKRRSCHQLRAPGPSDAELAQILQAGRRAPDFGRLRPYRFLAARGNGLDRLGQAMQRAAIAAGKSEQIVARALTMPHRAPLVIIVVATPRPDKNVPEFDQVLCAASTVLMMQLAARAQGYGGIWRSGWMISRRSAPPWSRGCWMGERWPGRLSRRWPVCGCGRRSICRISGKGACFTPSQESHCSSR